MEVALDNLSQAMSIKLIIGLSLLAIGSWRLFVYVDFFATNYYLDIARVLILAVICWLVMDMPAKHMVLNNRCQRLTRKLSIQSEQLAKTKDNSVVEIEKLNAKFATRQKIESASAAVLEENILA